MKILFLILLTTSLFAQNILLKNELNQFDYIIITTDEFADECKSFKEHKELYKNFSVLVTTKNNILEEFSSSQTIQENIRNFIGYAGANWKEPKPKYFLFAANVDSIPNFKFKSITHPDYNDTSYSDFYYSVDINNQDSINLSYAVGRVSANSTYQLTNYFNKVIKYESNIELEPWMNKALFVSDDQYSGDSNDGNIFIDIAEQVGSMTPDYITNNFIIPVDTSRYFGNTDSITTKLNSGVSSVFFCGHGENEVFTHESLYTINEIPNLRNSDRPFFVSIIGKQEFARKNVTSIMNELIVSPNGALVGINSVGIHYVGAGSGYFSQVWSKLYSDISIGDIFRNTTGSSNERRKYNIFGDPSIVLKSDITAEIEKIEIIPDKFYLAQNYPNPFNPTTKINYSITNAGITTLKVYNILGKEIAELVNKSQQSGNYSINFNASDLTSGIYFYSLTNGNISMTKKMILLK